MIITMKQTHGKKGRHTVGSSDGYLEYEVSKLPNVQAAIDKATAAISVKAKSNLEQHRDTGLSYIGVERDDVDRLITLHDELSDNAALMIEKETHVLHDAARM